MTGLLAGRDHDLMGLGRDFDTVFGRMFDLEPFFGKEGGFHPSVDITETEEAFKLTAEVPGLKPEEMEISLEGDVLTIKGEKVREAEEKKENIHRVERSFGSFSRSFRLPKAVKTEGVEAVFKDGLLTLELPKVEDEATKKIEVKKA